MSDAFEIAWTLVKNEEKNEEKKRSGNRFKGYSKNRISGRAERAGKARAWSQSRKVKRGRTRKRYARNKKRGNVRPKLRRQLGAGGERIQVKKGRGSRFGRGGEKGRTIGPTGKPLREPLYCIRPDCDRKLSTNAINTPARLRQCATCLRVHGQKGLDAKRVEHLRLMREQRAGDTGDVDPSDVAPT